MSPVPYLSGRSRLYRPQPMFELQAAAQRLESAGQEVIHLEIGDTKGFSNPHIVRELQQISRDPDLGYVGSGGVAELREAFAEEYTIEKGISLTSDNVVVAPANALISQVMGVTCDVGDAVLLPDPGFPTYFLAADCNGLRTTTYSLDANRGWAPDVAEIEEKIRADRNIRCLVINSPSNPLGSVIPADIINQLLSLAESYGIYCLFDETYKNLIFGRPVPTHRHSPNAVYLYSLSKDAAAPGLRVGCVVSEQTDLVSKIVDYNSLLYSCAPGITQRAALAYVTQPDRLSFAHGMANEIAARLEMFDAQIAMPEPLDYVRPSAAFYVFLDVSKICQNATRFSYDLLARERVAVCPGDAFGPGGAGRVRVTLAGEVQDLEEGARRLVRFVNSAS